MGQCVSIWHGVGEIDGLAGIFQSHFSYYCSRLKTEFKEKPIFEYFNLKFDLK